MNNDIFGYLNFIKAKGRPLADINPGSSEHALCVEDALYAIDLLEIARLGVIGGDILSEDEDGILVYALHSWGSQYYYLSWSCNRSQDESGDEYVGRSIVLAKKSIELAGKTAEELGRKCYVVLVV